MRSRRILFLGGVAGLAVTGLVVAGLVVAGAAGVATRFRPQQPGPTPGIVQPQPDEGLQFRLSEASPETPRVTAPRVAAATPLDEAEAQRILDRLPPIEQAPADVQAFAFPPASMPPPRTGKTIAVRFPPDAKPEAPDLEAAGPLRLLRHAPDGEVPLAPDLSVTFSQPMVAVATHEALARESVPVKLQPLPPGEWRWLGTKTLVFQSEDRLPMATDYVVEVPAGTKSTSGGALARTERWTFSTPPPSIVTSRPSPGPAVRDPLFFAEFDQRIDPAAVLETITVRAGTAGPSLRLATGDEVKADREISRLVERAGRGRWIAFKAEQPLPAAADITVTVGPGTPSAEGPRTTAKAHNWTFRTFGPMRIASSRCGYPPRNECFPSSPWEISFSNPIDPKRFSKELVRVEPPVPEFRVSVSDEVLYLNGRARGRTTYTVTISAAVADTFGQALGRDETVTFSVGPAQAQLWPIGGEIIAIEPRGRPSLPVYTTGIDSLAVEVRRVTPADWPAYRTYQRERFRNANAPPPVRSLVTAKVKVTGDREELSETRIDLGPGLEGGFGQMLVLVTPVAGARAERAPSAAAVRTVAAWVQVTNIGLDAFADGSELLAWTTALADGRPMQGVGVTLGPSAGARPLAPTGPDGLVRLELRDEPAPLLIARSGGDVAILPGGFDPRTREEGWTRRTALDELRWYVFDDRQLYRPGEEVKVKGWIRRVTAGKSGDVTALGGGTHAVSWTLVDSRRNEIGRGAADLNAWGGFDLAARLPASANLGPATLQLETAEPAVDGRDFRHVFQVQEFRRPEYEVKTTASEGPHLIGSHAVVTAAASYYAGGALPGAAVSWRVVATRGRFQPPNRGEYTFGDPSPPWRYDDEPGGARPCTETYSAVTDGVGQHRLRIDFDGVRPPRPSNVLAEATVQDVNRQAWTSRATLLVHPSDRYVGLKTDRSFVEQGEPIRVDLIVTDLDGAARPGRAVDVRAERVEREQVAGEWTTRYLARQDCSVTSAAGPVSCTFSPGEGGQYRIAAVVTDEQGRPNESIVRVWVAGGRVGRERGLAREQVTLVPGKPGYRAGETAEILVVAPFAPAEGLLTLHRSGIVRTERFAVAGGSYTLRFRLEEAWIPNVMVQVDLVGSAPRTDLAGAPYSDVTPRPAFAQGWLQLPIPPDSRTLAMSVEPAAKALEPGGETTLDLALTDSGGRPVGGAEVAVAVVDEAILSLTGYRVPDPLARFYAPRPRLSQDRHLRSGLRLAAAESVQVTAAAPVVEGQGSFGGGAAVRVGGNIAGIAGGVVGGVVGGLPGAPEATAGFLAAQQLISLRADFNPLALFAASVPTDESGRAQVRVKLPDNLTRYRVMAVAATDTNRFGSGESTITARLPLMVRASPPRFLNYGDRFELPVVVQNQTDEPLEVGVAARATNAALTAGRGRRVEVPANDRVEVRLPAATDRAGNARFQVGAVAGRFADATMFTLPIWTPATTEAFATYGQIDQGAIVQPVRVPPGVAREFGGLEVTTSSTALSALTDAVLYLVEYPFECAEQLASRVLAVVSLKDVLAAFKAEGLPPPDELRAAVARDLDRLASLQNDDGGFAFWRRGDESWPFVSIHVAHALARARAGGFEVKPALVERAKTYLRDVDARIPKEWGEQPRAALGAYALYVRMLLGERDAAGARGLVARVGVQALSFETLGWLLSVMTGDAQSSSQIAAIRRHLANRVAETAGAAHFSVSYRDHDYLLLNSDRRADAVILEALIADQPSSDLVPKLVQGLLAHRTAGRWTNTQENVFVLIALDRYFKTYEKTTPDFVARMWLGDRYAGEHQFKGRAADRAHLAIPMSEVRGEGGQTALALAKDGAGRLYYRVGLRYAPESLVLEPMDRGFVVVRRYEAVDDPSDVTRSSDGAWRIRAGSRVRIALTMVAPARRYHVALVDPLPAGLEALNPTLATTGSIPREPGRDEAPTGLPRIGEVSGSPSWWWRRTWYEHQNLRDDRVEAFASLLFAGVHRYSYVARATTPGTFVVPPPRAEEMYSPETFGRGGTDRVIVR